ncbi:MAG TPA: FAD/NAD(P)-binding oxidoreductase [Steroidobacteraceae bacterium]|nr:FAD/NAD(P)-binding oxidoreductase [Steroidobacteraceae bacterium]
MRRRTFLGALLGAGLRNVSSAAAAGARLVVVGGGFAGSACALALRRLLPGARIRLIDPEPHYHTCPMSNAALVGLRTLASLSVARAPLRGAGIEYSAARATGIDAGRRRVHLATGEVVGYDRLVVAPGIRLLPDRPEGYDARAARLMPHAWTGAGQAALLAAALRAVPDGGTVAISVPAGLMRCPPGPYERAGLFAGFLARRRRRCKVLIFDANNHFPRQDQFTAAWQSAYPNMIEWLPPQQGGEVTRVDAAAGVLYSSTGAHRVALASVIPPQAPGQIATDSGLATGHGWCPVHGTSFESEAVPGVHVIGDACIAGAMPKAASAAASQALQCAAAIAAALLGRAPPPAALASVCYSLLSAEHALAIHGAFALENGQIVAAAPAPAAEPGGTGTDEANRWYRAIRAQCFAD